MASLLIYCMEWYLRDLNTVHVQAQVGFELIHKWRAEHPRREIDPTVIEDDMISEFSRCDLHFATFWGDRPLETHKLRRREGEASIRSMPSGFSDLEEQENTGSFSIDAQLT
ncbi:hypothetical protein LSUE1_G009255 [Lachnellula suecica]|uniref:Uncharacterized protein n=1 Tax=Lachnellula suecica TaxID=602035 RepID=A0A8T9BZT2_9HELO|nr:hypothetical protein LSUE1_G009255 [Lachnellula suecica]